MIGALLAQAADWQAPTIDWHAIAPELVLIVGINIVLATDLLVDEGKKWATASLSGFVLLGAFVPIVGGFVSGFVAVVVALVALGWVPALIMLAAIIAVVEIEGHILQPFLMGRAVKLHPLAVLLAIAVGIILGGIVGALFAVPMLAFVKTFVQHLSDEIPNPATPTVVR